MSFKVTYNGDIQYVKVFYSTEKTRAGKYYGEFYKKMDALASDLKRLKQELDEDSEKAAKIAKDAANKALSERFGSLRYLLMSIYGMKTWLSARFSMTEKKRCWP